MENEEKKSFKETVNEKAHDFKDWSYDKWVRFKWFVADHKEEIVVFGLPALAGVGELIKLGARQNRVKKEQALKDEYIYDRSGGHYWKLRRKPTNNEWAEIERRRRSGERYSTILTDMRLL